jgi:uncharacterized protein YfaS (alpha-2-macroglobulin family)
MTVRLETSRNLEIIGAASQAINVAPKREGLVTFKIKAKDGLGNADLTFSASEGRYQARTQATLSLRPALPYQVQLDSLLLKAGKSEKLNIGAPLYAEQAETRLRASSLPLAMGDGLISYLGHYPYSCTEQLSSQAIPALILPKRPELGSLKKEQGAAFAGLIDELRRRQTADGAFRYWPGTDLVNEYVSVYATQVLLEAKDRGQAVPVDLLQASNDYLLQLARRDGNNLEQERSSAFALYLLTRQGQVLSAELSSSRERLQRYKKDGQQDLASAYLAAAAKLMKQDRLARDLLAGVPWDKKDGDGFFNKMTTTAVRLQLVSMHFPEDSVPVSALESLATDLRERRVHSLAAASTLLGLDAYATRVGAAQAGRISALADGAALALVNGQARFAPNTQSLQVRNDSDQPAFVGVLRSGYEKTLPTQALAKGLEVSREFLNSAGKPVVDARQGDELTVVLKVRSSKATYGDVALVDLLPGGFEIIVPPAPEASPSSEEGEESDESSSEASPCWVCTSDSARPDYVDVKEDRAIFYTYATPEARIYRYKVRVTSSGSFVVPPAYAESMYSPLVQGRSVAGRFIVTPSNP